MKQEVSRPRKGDWMQTFTGIQFWPMDPRPEDVCIEDIAHSLSMQCRFAGHSLQFYSVAEHSIYVSQIVSKRNALWGLLHDASEAYLVDLPRPIKRGSAMGDIYREMEDGVMRCICEKFGLDDEFPPEVKWADNVLLMTEKRDLMGPSPQDWIETERPLRERITTTATPIEAERAFLKRFYALTNPVTRELVLQWMGL